MPLSNKFPTFEIRKDQFPMNIEGQRLYNEVIRLTESLKDLHKSLVSILYQRIQLVSYTNKAAANLAFTGVIGQIAYNTTDAQPMFHNGTTWKKIVDGTTAS